MSMRTTLTSILTPVLLPIVLFFFCYFLFPSFSYEFFGVSFKESKRSIETQTYNRQTEFKGNTTYKTTHNVGLSQGFDMNISLDVPESNLKDSVNDIKSGVDTIRNVLEFAEETGKNAQSVVDKIRQNSTRN